MAALGAIALTLPATAQLDRILKGAAIVGDPNREAGNKTKVVPIVSVGQGASAGPAQVSGPAHEEHKARLRRRNHRIGGYETMMKTNTLL